MSDDDVGALVGIGLLIMAISVALALIISAAVIGGVAWLTYEVARFITGESRQSPRWQEHELRRYAAHSTRELGQAEQRAKLLIEQSTDQALETFQRTVDKVAVEQKQDQRSVNG